MIWVRSRALIAAILGGVLYALSNVGYGIWPLAFVALVPLWFALERYSDDRFRSAFILGLSFGLAVFAVGFPWLLSLSQGFLKAGSVLSLMFWLGAGLWFAVSFAMYALVYKFLRIKSVGPLTAGIALFVLMEWLQPNLFPSFLGAALVNAPSLVQIADLGGPLLLSLFVLTVNGLIYQFLQNQTNWVPISLSGFCLIGLVVLYGVWSERGVYQQYDDAASLRVGSVQTNLVRLPKDELSFLSHKTHLKQSEALLAIESLDLLIWPETAYVRGLRRSGTIDGRLIRGNIDVPILFGGTSVWQDEGRKVSANSVFLADQDGVIDQVYDKNILIPFAEYLPSPDKWGTVLKDLFPFSQHFKAGERQTALRLDDWLIQTPICFEVIHHDFIRESINGSEPHFMVTLANDSWFGDSQEPWIHLALARLRAIENRIWVVRATNSGISAVIDPFGKIISQTSLNTKENMVATIYPKQTGSLFTRHGDWVAWLAIILLFLAPLMRLEREMVVSPSSS